VGDLEMKKVFGKFIFGILLLQLSGLVAAAENAAVSAGDTNTAVSVEKPVVPAVSGKAQYELEDVVITGTKTKLRVKDSPAAVSVVTQEQKKNEGSVVYADDLVTDLPGVQVQRATKGTQTTIVSMRGVPEYTRNLVLLDGFGIQNPNNARPFWNSVPVALVDHVEVVRGPFSSLYGKYALGGVINIITKEPEGTSFNLDASYDSTNIRTTNVNFSDKPLDQFAYYIGYENTSTDGYTYNQYVEKNATTAVTGKTYQQVDGYKTTTDVKGNPQFIVGQLARTQISNNDFTAKLFYTPSLEQKISLLLNYSKWDQPTNNALVGNTFLKDHTTGALVSSGTVQLAGTNKVVTVNQSDFFTGPGYNSIESATLNYDGKINDVVGVSAGAQFKSGPSKHTVDAIATNATAFTGSATTSSDNNYNVEGVENAQVDFKLPQNHVIVGVNNDNSINTSDTSYFPYWGDFTQKTVLYENQKVQEDLDAVFLQDEWKILNSLTAFIGARYDNWTIRDGMIYDVSLGRQVFFDPRNRSVVSPKVSLVYKPVEEASVRVSAGRAFNPPTELQMFSYSLSATSESVPNPLLNPEIDNAWEIGGEYTLPTQTTVSATYFQNYLTDLIYTQTDIVNNFTTTHYVNAGKATIKGIEAEVKQPVLSFLNAFANYTYVDPRVVENNSVPASVGKIIPDVAPQTGTLGLDFKWGKIDAVLTGVFASKRYILADNSDTVSGVQGSYDPYAIANFKLNYAFNGGKVSFGIDNLTDLQYYTQYRTTGRSFNLGANFNFF
jgi:iron complex outermembrane receptor protein